MEQLTFDFTIGGNHCWQVKGADNLECREVCERQGDDRCKTCPIAKAFDRLAAYEDTGLEPERVSDFDRLVQLFYSAGLDEKFVLACIELTNVGMAIDRLRELAQADREGRVVVIPEGGYSDKDGEKALKNAMYVCSFTNNAVNRYITDAIAEKLTREEADAVPRRE